MTLAQTARKPDAIIDAYKFERNLNAYCPISFNAYTRPVFRLTQRFRFGGYGATSHHSSIKQVQNNENEETVNSGVYLEIVPPCSQPLSDITKMNIGKTMTISYGGQLVQKATTTSRLSNGFMFNTNGGNMMVIRQIIADYEAK